MSEQWLLDRSITFLNHGSFGACPRTVLDAQRRFRAQMEAEPVRFFTREMQPVLQASLDALGECVGGREAGRSSQGCRTGGCRL